MNQREQLMDAENLLGVGPVEMAGLMGTPYSTYKKWRSDKRTVPAVGWRCLTLILENQAEKGETT